jgi:hypothetical protein
VCVRVLFVLSNNIRIKLPIFHTLKKHFVTEHHSAYENIFQIPSSLTPTRSAGRASNTAHGTDMRATDTEDHPGDG